jgi:hypothetical protein
MQRQIYRAAPSVLCQFPQTAGLAADNSGPLALHDFGSEKILFRHRILES